MGCSTQAHVSLPLHREEEVAVPRSVGRQYVATYLAGYENGWLATLQTFSQDIDHKRDFMEDVAVGDSNYLDGWFAGRNAAEAMIRQLVTTEGRDRARAKLAEAVKTKKEANQMPEPTGASAPVAHR